MVAATAYTSSHFKNINVENVTKKVRVRKKKGGHYLAPGYRIVKSI